MFEIIKLKIVYSLTFFQFLITHMKKMVLILSLIFLYSCRPSDTGPAPTPTSNGTIFTGATDGYMYAVDAGNGDIKWKVPVGDIFMGSATMLGKLVVFASRNNTVVAADAKTGAVEWKISIASPTAAGVTHPPMINGRFIHVNCNNGTAFTFDTTIQVINGVKYPTILWSKVFGSGKPLSGAAASNGLEFIGTDSTIRALDVVTGAFKWTYPVAGGCYNSNPVTVNNVLYVYGQNGILYALNAISGNLIWQQTIESNFGGATYASPVTWNNTIYVGYLDGVTAIDMNNGAIKWRSEMPVVGSGGITNNNAVAIYNGILYATSSNNYLLAWDAITGKFKWGYNTGGTSILTSPNAAEDFVVAINENGTIHLLNATTGALKWQKRIITGSYRIIYSSPTILDKNGVVHLPGEAGEVN
jgi:eukaryotic-like serine/threonine-protein kinase